MDERLCKCGCGQSVLTSGPSEWVYGHKKRRPAVPCKCGCGTPTRGTWAHGHDKRSTDPSYGTVHKRILPEKSGTCSKCKRTPGRYRSGYEGTAWAYIPGQDHGGGYSTNPEDYIELCRSCHVRHDGATWTDKKLPSSTGKKISIALTGRKHTDEHRANNSAAQKRVWAQKEANAPQSANCQLNSD